MGTDCPPEHNVCHSYAREVRVKVSTEPCGKSAPLFDASSTEPEGAVPNCDPELLDSKPMLVLNCCIMIIIISSPQMPQ